MKKILIALTIVISFIGIKSVSADSTDLFFTNVTEEKFTQYKEIIGSDNFNLIVNDMLEEYKTYYMTSYPYFIISPSITVIDDNGNFSLNIVLSYYDEIPTLPWSYSQNSGYGVHTVYTRLVYDDICYYGRSYTFSQDDAYYFDLNTYESYSLWAMFNLLTSDYGSYVSEEGNFYNPYLYYMSNFDLYLEPLNNLKSKISSAFIFDYDTLMIPKLGEETIYSVVSFDNDSHLIEPYYLYDTDADVTIPTYTEINLNDYAYVALALKNYDQDAFTTTVQVKGQYCITPVYDHGLKTYDSVVGSKVQNICSPYYSDYTPVVTTITQNNIDNYAIYYVKAYNTEQDNYIKVDNNVFDITYISEEDASNPYVYVDGKTYPTIAYENLTSSATQNTEEGYVPGESEEFSFSDIFTAPLEFLEDIWDSITGVFSLMTELISLLPEPMQSFLYLSFMLAIIIGLIKIIL